jgi:hypothetical protein
MRTRVLTALAIAVVAVLAGIGASVSGVLDRQEGDTVDLRFALRGDHRPAGVVVVGSDGDIDSFSWQLEKALPVPVFGQSMAQVTIARGAALAAAQSTEFTDEQLVAEADEPAAAPARPRRLSYTGAAAALAAATVTFVASLSLAVGLQIAPDQHRSTPRDVVHTPAPQVAEAVTPAVTPPRTAGSRTPQPAPPLRLTSEEPDEESGASGQP